MHQLKRIGFFICLLIFALEIDSFSQEVEHNYKVGPQVTTCDSLVISDSLVKTAIQQIKSSKFRFQQSFKLTRRQGFKGGEYFSCDGIKGFLILAYNEEELLFINVDKNIWDELIGSSDPEGYFLDVKSSLEQFLKIE